MPSEREFSGAMNKRIHQHCDAINSCNQRGSRMLSIFDLLESGSLDLDLASFLMARISRNASLMIGAQPGGAGKTTIMCALLNLLHEDTQLIAATEVAVASGARGFHDGHRCYVCHEIGAGSYFAYLWGSDLRDFCALQEQGAMLATNLHADTLEEAQDQVCLENGVPEAHFNAFDLILFLRVSGGWGNTQRVISSVHVSDGTAPHELGFCPHQGLQTHPWAVDQAYVKQCRDFLERNLAAGVRTIEDTRARVLDFYRS
jgi:hypothetical protein